MREVPGSIPGQTLLLDLLLLFHALRIVREAGSWFWRDLVLVYVLKGAQRVWMLRVCAKSAVDDLECEDPAVHVWLVVLNPGCFRAWSDFVSWAPLLRHQLWYVYY